MRWFGHLTGLLLHFYGAHLVPALFVLLCVESAGVPLPAPGDAFILLAGARRPPGLVYTTETLAAGILGATLGASLLHAVARRVGRPFLDRYGKYIFLRPEHLHKMERWYARLGMGAVILGWLIPGLRIPTTVMTGLANLSWRQFLRATLPAATIWVTAYYLAGVFLHTLDPIYRRVTFFLLAHIGRTILVAVAVLIVLAVLLNLVRAARANAARRSSQAPETRQEKEAEIGRGPHPTI